MGSVLLLSLILICASAHAEQGCNIADVLFGKTRLKLIPRNGYETGITFGDDYDSKRFSYDRILGQIDGPECDGSRKVSNIDGTECGHIDDDLRIDTSGSDCYSCSKTPVTLKEVGKLVGILNDRLNK